MGLPEIEIFKNDKVPVKLNNKNASHWQILKEHIFTNPYMWLLSISSTFIYIIRFGTLDWSTKFMYDVKGMDEISVAMFWTLMPLAGMPGGILAGYIADKYFEGRCTPINLIYLALLAISITGFYFLAGPDHYILTGAFLLCIGFFVDGPQNLVGGVQTSRITVNEAIGTACGFNGIFSYVGAAISGIGLAYITKHFGWGGMYGTCVASCGITAILISFTWNKEKGDQNAS
jgi:sugar phosphate permease